MQCSTGVIFIAITAGTAKGHPPSLHVRSGDGGVNGRGGARVNGAASRCGLTIGRRGAGIGHGGTTLGELAPPPPTYQTPRGKKRHVLTSLKLAPRTPARLRHLWQAALLLLFINSSDPSELLVRNLNSDLKHESAFSCNLLCLGSFQPI